MIYKIERGKPLLDSDGKIHPLHHQGGKIFFDRQSFGVLIAMPGVSRAEANAFRKGPLSYGVYVHEHIPFLVLNFEQAFCIDCSFNFFDNLQAVDEFLEADANAVQMILCDQNGSVVKGIRLIGAEPAAMFAIRATGHLQLQRYDSPDGVVAAIREAERALQPEQMLAQTKKWRIK